MRGVGIVRFIVTGGGTGGHIYPALAIARGLQNRYPDCKVFYVGTARGMEADIVPKEGIPFIGIAGAGLHRKLSPKNLLVLWQAGRGFFQALGTVRRIKPHVVIGTGGYVCGPVVLAASLCRIPTLIHEQNALPGITNRLLSRFTNKVAVTFAGSEKYFPRKASVKLTGLPVRPEILRAERKGSYNKLGFVDNSRLLLLSFGGSRGAQSLNKAMETVIAEFAGNSELNILHVTGKTGYDEFISRCVSRGIYVDKIGNVNVKPYMYDMQDVLSSADLLISRAGAATLAEITALGIPSVLVPYPYASENHQEYNARALEKAGAAVVVLDRDLNGKLLCRLISELLDDPRRLEMMASASKRLGKKNALQDIIECVVILAQSKKR